MTAKLEPLNITILAKRVQILRNKLRVRLRDESVLTPEQKEMSRQVMQIHSDLVDSVNSVSSIADQLDSHMDEMQLAGCFTNRNIKLPATPSNPEHLTAAQVAFEKLLATHPRKTINIYGSAGVTRQAFYFMRKNGIATPQFAASIEKVPEFSEFKKEILRPDISAADWKRLAEGE